MDVLVRDVVEMGADHLELWRTLPHVGHHGRGTGGSEEEGQHVQQDGQARHASLRRHGTGRGRWLGRVCVSDLYCATQYKLCMHRDEARKNFSRG